MLPEAERVFDQAGMLALCAAVTAQGGVLALRVHGRSMLPGLPDGCQVKIGPLPLRPALGTIVLADLGATAVLHRVLWRRSDALLLAGDANRRVDGWVPRKQWVGALVARHAAHGWRPERRWCRRLGWAGALIRRLLRYIKWMRLPHE